MGQLSLFDFEEEMVCKKQVEKKYCIYCTHGLWNDFIYYSDTLKEKYSLKFETDQEAVSFLEKKSISKDLASELVMKAKETHENVVYMKSSYIY